MNFIKLLIRALDRGLYCVGKGGYLVDVGWFRSFKEKKSIDKDGKPIPWLAYPVIEFLDRRLSKDMSVFEYGCGASTIWFCSKVKEVISCEHDKVWHEQVSQSSPENAEILFRDVESGEYAREISNYSGQFDIIFVDGRDRVNCIKNSLDALKKNGIIILDDSFREEYSEATGFLFENGFKSIEISGPAPIYCNYSSTKIFYRTENVFNI
jgi:precorrin-6B methylase 2